jgi:hypothetical protein
MSTENRKAKVGEWWGVFVSNKLLQAENLNSAESALN